MTARALLACLLLLPALVGCQELADALPFAAAPPNGHIIASGVIQAEEVTVTAELGGRVADVLAREGQAVAAGEVVIRLDDSAIVAKIGQAEAALAIAKAELVEVQARPRAEAVAVARAALEQAIAVREGARRAWEDAQAMLENPQELEARLEEAKTQLALAEQAVEAAQVDLTEARNLRDRYAYPSGEYYVHSLLAEAAVEAVAAAEAERDAAQAALDGLRQIAAEPLELRAAANAAEGAYRKAVAAVAVAEAALAATSAPARPEEVALYRAKVSQAERALQVLRVQQAKQALRAPRGGVVTSVALQPGEVALPGAPIMTIADLTRTEVTIYVQEPDLSRVWLGQEAEVTVDSFPGRAFAGRVVYIASEAQFTPKNVQTPDERVQTVFAVRIAVENPDLALKPGMPADARLRK